MSRVDLGPLTRLLDDPATTDVLVNAPDEVWVDRGAGLVRVPVRFVDENAVRALAVRLAAGAGRRLDTGAPFADVRLADGSRLHAGLPPAAPRGPPAGRARRHVPVGEGAVRAAVRPRHAAGVRHARRRAGRARPAHRR